MTSLTNKYRPKKWKDVAGHEAEILRMQGIIKSKNIPDSFFFGGGTGTGKTTLARIFANYLNCETNNLCGECSWCLASKKGHNPDIVEINAANARGIDDARALIESIKYKPQIGKYKVVIIDEVQQLTKQAEQALLTTLEEPPKHVRFMLCSMEPENCEEALVTRGSLFDLTPPSPSEIEKRLKTICKKEKIKIDSEVLSAIAHNCQGCVRYGIQLLEACFQTYYADPKNPKIKSTLLNKVLKVGDDSETDLAASILVAIFAGDYKAVHTKLLNVSDFPVLINKMSYLVMYQIDRLLIKGNHKNVWHTVANKSYYDALVKKTGKVNLTKSYAVLDDLVALKQRMGTFMANDRHLFTSTLVKRAVKNRK